MNEPRSPTQEPFGSVRPLQSQAFGRGSDAEHGPTSEMNGGTDNSLSAANGNLTVPTSGEELLSSSAEVVVAVDQWISDSDTISWATAATYPPIPGYEVECPLGRGGMGIVYKARHQRLNRIVALKMILEHAKSDEIFRFRTEPEAAARLQHPNVVQIFEVGEYCGRPYLALEFVDGGNLANKIQGTPWLPRQAAVVVEQLARAVQHAHDAGIIHRDLKPANILMTSAGVPKITDFGVAKRLDDDSGLTRTGMVIGSPSYMAPEQAAGEAHRVGPEADIYALGAILYECLTGRPPFKGASVLDTLEQVRLQEPVSPRQLQPKLPLDLETVCLKCLQKDSQKRFSSAAALADDLTRFIDGRPVLARPVGRMERLWRWTRRNRTVAWLLLTVAIILVVAIAAVVWFAVEARYRAEEAGNSAAKERSAKNLAEANRIAADKSAAAARWRAYVSDLQRIGTEWEDGRIDRVRSLLDGQLPERVDGKDLRGPEWHLWDHLCRSETLTFGNHAGPVMNVAFSSDGNRVASVSTDYGFQPGGKGLKVWEVESGRVVHELPGVNQFAWSPDGKWLAAPAEDDALQEIVVWNAATGQEFCRFNIFHSAAAQMYAMAFSPDSTLLAFRGPSYSFRLWDLASGKEVRLFDGHLERVTGIAFRPDGNEIVTVSGDGMLRVWNIFSGTCLRTIVISPQAELWAVAYSPDGKWLAAAGDDRTLKLLDAVTGRERYTLKTRGYTIRGIAFSPDSQLLAAGGSDGIVRVWETESRGEMWRFRGHTGPVRAVAFSSDGRKLASSGDDGMVKLWPGGAGPAAVTFKSRVTSRSNTGGWWRFNRYTHAYRPDGRRLALAAEQGGICVFDAESGVEVVLIAADQAKRIPVAIAYSQDGSTLATVGYREKTVRLWDADTGREFGSRLVHPNLVKTLTYSPDGKQMATVCWPENYGNVKTIKPQIKSWEVVDGRERYSIESEIGIFPLAYSPDGKLLAAGECSAAKAVGSFRDVAEALIRIFDADDGREIRSFVAHADDIFGLAFSPDGTKLASASADRSVKVWNVDSGKQVLELQGHADGVRTVGFSRDGTRLASSSWNPSREHDETILWDIPSGQPVLVFDEFFGEFSPDGKRLLTIGQQTASVWELTPVTEEHMLRRDAAQLLQHNLERLWLKEDVLAAISADPSAMLPVRRRAQLFGESYQELPERLSIESWKTVRSPGAAVDAYRLALRQSEEAIRKTPNNANFQTSLAAALYRTGRPADAVPALKQSLKIRPDGPAALAFLAMAQKQLGANDAEATLTRLLKILQRNPAARDNWTRQLLIEARKVVLGIQTFSLEPETWSVVGPFDNPEQNKGLGPEYPPEKGVDLGANFAGKTAGVAWQSVHPNHMGYVDLLPAIADSVNVISYAYCEVDSPAEQDVDVYLGTDDGARLWINGVEVFTHAQPRRAVANRDLVQVSLPKGRNTFLLKIVNISAQYGFFFRIESPQELKTVR